MRSRRHLAFGSEPAYSLAGGVEVRIWSKLCRRSRIGVGECDARKLISGCADISGRECHLSYGLFEAKGPRAESRVPKVPADRSYVERSCFSFGSICNSLFQTIDINFGVGGDVVGPSIGKDAVPSGV